MPEHAITRYMVRHESWRWRDEREATEILERFIGAAGRDPIAQVMAVAVLPLQPTCEDLLGSPEGAALHRLAAGQDRYQAAPRADVLAMVAALLVSLDADLRSGVLRLDAMLEGLEQTRREIVRQGREEWAYSPQATLEAVQAAGRLDRRLLDLDRMAQIGFAVTVWKRLLWLASCRARQAIVLGHGQEARWPRDEQAAVFLAHRMAWNQPQLMCWPKLALALPLRGEEWLGIADEVERALEGLAPADPARAQELARDGRERRGYVLDHVARVRTDALGIRSLTLAPERLEPYGRTIGALLESARGTFACEVLITPDDQVEASTTLADTLDFQSAQSEALRGSIGLLVVACWRDLVVREVREQQYSRELLGVGRRSRRGNSNHYVGYLPRRIALREAASAEATARGSRITPRPHRVGAFTRRLPAGRSRSHDASEFAAQIGIPLGPRQTIVQPHVRGGTPAERRRESLEVREWRSWSALDLLRTARD